jgi:hypothetical protein
MGVRVYVLVTFVMTLVAACGTQSRQSTHTPRWVQSQLGASFVQFRSDEGTRHVAISVTNKTRQTIHVTGVQLRWSGVTSQPVTRQDNDVIPGTTVAFFVDLQGLRCDRGDERPRALVIASGRTGLLTIDRPGERFLRDVWRRGCADQAVRAAADLAFGSTWQAAGSTPAAGLRGALLMTRRQPGPTVTITSFSGSVLLDLLPVVGHRPIGVLQRGHQRLVIPVVIRSSRLCTQHALSQSTQTFLLRVGVKTGDTSTLIIVSPDTATQDKIKRNIERSCQIQNRRQGSR